MRGDLEQLEQLDRRQRNRVVIVVVPSVLHRALATTTLHLVVAPRHHLLVVLPHHHLDVAPPRHHLDVAHSPLLPVKVPLAVDPPPLLHVDMSILLGAPSVQLVDPTVLPLKLVGDHRLRLGTDIARLAPCLTVDVRFPLPLDATAIAPSARLSLLHLAPGTAVATTDGRGRGSESVSLVATHSLPQSAGRFAPASARTLGRARSSLRRSSRYDLEIARPVHRRTIEAVTSEASSATLATCQSSSPTSRLPIPRPPSDRGLARLPFRAPSRPTRFPLRSPSIL